MSDVKAKIEGYEELFKLECPFNWDMTLFNLEKLNDDTELEAFLPELHFARVLMQIYKLFVKEEFKEVEEKFKICENLIAQFNSLKKDVAEHILLSTKAHYLMRTKKTDQVDTILRNIKSIEEKKYSSNLNEFKAAVWTQCNDYSYTASIAIKFAEVALDCDCENSTAHYLLGKNLRKLRRVISVFDLPSKEELYHFNKAYEIENNFEFGIYLGLSFKEARNKVKAFEIFNELNESIENPFLKLRLALYFMQNKNLEQCKNCLDYVESIIPDNSMYLHYRGLYFIKQKMYQKALEHLQRAGEKFNYAADLGYAKCMRIIGKRFDFPAYFLSLLSKYDDMEIHRRKEVYLHVAFSYFKIKRDIKLSIKYFYEAFQIESEKFSLEKYHDPITEEDINVYRFLMEQVFTKMKTYIENKTINLPEEIIEANEKLERLCTTQFSKLCEERKKKILDEYHNKIATIDNES